MSASYLSSETCAVDVVTRTCGRGERKRWAVLQVPDDWAAKEGSTAAN